MKTAAETKPFIKKCGFLWECSGAGCARKGKTAASAYANWYSEISKKDVALRAAVESARRDADWLKEVGASLEGRNAKLERRLIGLSAELKLSQDAHQGAAKEIALRDRHEAVLRWVVFSMAAFSEIDPVAAVGRLAEKLPGACNIEAANAAAHRLAGKMANMHLWLPQIKSSK